MNRDMRSRIIRQNGDVKCTPRIDLLQFARVGVSVRKRLGLGSNESNEGTYNQFTRILYMRC